MHFFYLGRVGPLSLGVSWAIFNLPHKSDHTCLIRAHYNQLEKTLTSCMCQKWSQVELYLEVLKNDEHEMHIKNICKTTKMILSVVHFVSVKKFLSEYGDKYCNLYSLDGTKHPGG